MEVGGSSSKIHKNNTSDLPYNESLVYLVVFCASELTTNS